MTLIPNGNYRGGAVLLGFSHLKRLKNEWRLVFEYPPAIDRTVREAGPGTIGAMIASLVLVSSDMLPPPASYFTWITSVSNTYGVQLFIDEVVPGYATRDQAPR